jgi:hypothetical protein
VTRARIIPGDALEHLQSSRRVAVRAARQGLGLDQDALAVERAAEARRGDHRLGRHRLRVRHELDPRGWRRRRR